MFNYISIFIFGLFVGSFLNCVIFRLEKSKSFLKGRSFCPHCRHTLAWYDLIPVLSFIILKRRCRHCKKPISWQYPLVEIATGTLFVLTFWHLPSCSAVATAGRSFVICYLDFLALIYYLLIACFLIIIFVYDLKHFIIPDKVLYPAIAVSFLYRLVEPLILTTNYQLPAINYLLSALGVSGFFLLIYLVSKGKWLGFGDVKLGVLLGLLLGWPNILAALFLSFTIGGIIGIGLIIFSHKKLKSQVPFAPFLIIGALIALFWGKQIIFWYFSLIF